MTFIVILVALLIERFFDWSHLRRWAWFADLQSRVVERVGDKSPYLALALTIIPVLLAVTLVEYVLSNTLFGLMGFVLQLFVLLYCLGPQNLWADTLSGQLAEQIFIAANRRIFACVFWFIVLGPVGVVFYRMITLSAADFPEQKSVAQLVPNARAIESVLDWVPVRLFACILALSGHCVQVLSCWRKKAGFSLHLNEVLLTECGAAALGSDDVSHIAEDGAATKNAISLLDRSLVIMVVAIAVLALI